MPGSSPFAHRDFRLLLIGQTASQFGAQVSAVAVPMLAVLTLHASPLQVGLINASSTAAFALLSLPAGAWLDRLPLRPVLTAADAVRALLLLAVPVAAWCGRLGISQLVAVTLLVGVARVLFDLGYQGYLPSVVGTGQVLAGNSAMETARAAGQFAGPGLGGWLIGLVGAADVVGIQAATFAVSAVSLLLIRTRQTPSPRLPERKALTRQIREGVEFVLHDRVLRAVAVTSAMSNFAFAISSAVTMIFLTRDLGLAPSLVGLVVAAGSIAALAGAAMTPRLGRRWGTARVVWLALATTGPVTLLGPAAQPGWRIALVVVGAAAGELGQIVYAITNLSLRQVRCPGHLLSRVNATMRFVILGLAPLGALVGGAMAEAAGIRATLFVAQGLVVAASLPVYLALRRTREVSDLTGRHLRHDSR